MFKIKYLNNLIYTLNINVCMCYVCHGCEEWFNQSCECSRFDMFCTYITLWKATLLNDPADDTVYMCIWFSDQNIPFHYQSKQ